MREGRKAERRGCHGGGGVGKGVIGKKRRGG